MGAVAAIATAGLLICTVGACAASAPRAVPLRANQALSTKVPAAAQQDHIHELIAGARCDTDQQCRVAGLGARPCGGPESFVAWSVRDTDAVELQRWLRAYADERQRWFRTRQFSGTCEQRPTPAVHCAIAVSEKLGQCQLSAADTGPK